MPLYFAYGANMDMAAMARRCPASRPLGLAALDGHAIFVMVEGFASVRRAPGGVVHGLLWDLSPADEPALDDFEDIDGGLYRKAMLPVRGPDGIAPALVYCGTSAAEGLPRPGYIEGVLAAGRAIGLPGSYLDQLDILRRAGTQGRPFDNGATPEGS